MLRVIAGSAKGRRLATPPGTATRPTSDRVREAIFNSLQSIVDMAAGSVAVADLFAGSGAMGIEALSRGASSCAFVESDRKAAEVIRANLATTGLAEQATVVQVDAVRWATSAKRRFDVVFADPPYAFDGWASLAGLDAGVVVAESDREVELGDGWRILKAKRYGSTVVTLITPWSRP